MADKRMVCLNCIDGRVQVPVINWIKENHKADNIDMITEPGMDGLLSNPESSIEAVNQKVQISIDKNNASHIFIVGHYDCKGNPVTESEHKEGIALSVARLKEVFPQKPIIGLWVNENWAIEPLTSSSNNAG